MSRNWVKDINKMHTHYGVHEALSQLDADKLRMFLEFRVKFLQEELDEMRTAENAEDVVDALIDLCVVAIGTLDAFGINSYKAWDEVLKANMKKKIGIKESRPNPLGLPDLIKPEGWKAPSHVGNHGDLPEVFE
jgi:predicted HAD superfamily Cof-like phosphohydrolase